MSKEGFYLQCPSNASMDIFKTNTLSSYIVNFKQPIVLKGEYDVGLAEIQYPRSWNNIRTDGTIMDIKCETNPNYEPVPPFPPLAMFQERRESSAD